jgi:hypothetical protein
MTHPARLLLAALAATVVVAAPGVRAAAGAPSVVTGPDDRPRVTGRVGPGNR